jgi:hypothetical protein
MYIKFADDPVRQRVSTAFGEICNGDPKKNSLKLIDKCFSIFKKEQQLAAFCELGKLNYPVDGFSVIDVTLCPQEPYSVFDNQLQTITQVNTKFPLNENKAYARGVMLWVDYPMSTDAGSEISPADLHVLYQTVDHTNTNQMTVYMHEFYSHFSNPYATDATQLINRLVLVNPNLDFSVRLKGMVIFAKTNTDPNNTSC